LECDLADFSDVDEVYEVDERGRYRGMISKKYGKWATGWNMVPNDEESFIHADKKVAVETLKQRYPL
jgi:hypothetical protein